MTYAKTLKGEKIADCASAWNGRPAVIQGFQSGISGKLRLTSRRNGCICCGASPSSGFAGRCNDAGFDAAHGAWNHSMSEFESTLPGTSAGETNNRASARKARHARKFIIA